MKRETRPFSPYFFSLSQEKKREILLHILFLLSIEEWGGAELSSRDQQDDRREDGPDPRPGGEGRLASVQGADQGVGATVDGSGRWVAGKHVSEDCSSCVGLTLSLGLPFHV